MTGATVVPYPEGSFCDVVALPGGGFAFAYLTATKVMVERDAGPGGWSVPIEHGPGLYLRCATNPVGDIAVAYQGQNGILYAAIEGDILRPFGLTYGENVVGLYWNRDFIAIVQRSAKTFERIVLPTGEVLETITLPVGTSQGLRDVRPDGTYVLGDAANAVTVYGISLHKPVTRGAVTVGQSAAGITAVTKDGHWTAIPSGNAYGPRLALDGTTSLICAWTDKGAMLSFAAFPYPYEATPPPPKPPEPEMTKPKVTVKEWHPVENNTKLFVADVGNGTTVTVWFDGQGLKISAANPLGTDTTGTYRKVL